MSAFAGSTEKILQTGLSSSSSSLGIQVSHDPPGNENRRLKIAAAVVFVLITLIACAALVGIYLSQPPPPPEVFTIILKDPEAERPARMKVKFVKMDHVELNRSPVLNSHDVVYIMKDFSRGLVAHKDFRQGLCLVGRLNDTEDSGKQRAKAFKNKVIQVAATEDFLILNGTIHREVLEYAAGPRLTRYCGNLHAYWIVRRMPSDPLPLDAHRSPMHHSDEEDVITTKALPSEDVPNEEDKMQILTDTNGNDELQTEQELPPPEDPQLIQEAEKTHVLEEKTSILAEKLDLPEESLRPNKGEEQLAAMMEEKSPNAEDTAPTDALPDIPFLFGSPPKFDDEGPPMPPPSQSDGVTNAEEAAAAAEFGISDEKNDELTTTTTTSTEKVKTDEVKSTADEKSTVPKPPHIDAEDAAGLGRLMDEEFILEKLDRKRENETFDFRGDEDISAIASPNLDTLSMDLGKTSSPQDVEYKDLPRRKRNACTVRCWYFIRKLKGYRRCMHRCF